MRQQQQQQQCTDLVIYLFFDKQYIMNYSLSHFPLAVELLIMAQSRIYYLLLEGPFKGSAEIIGMSLSLWQISCLPLNGVWIGCSTELYPATNWDVI